MGLGFQRWLDKFTTHTAANTQSKIYAQADNQVSFSRLIKFKWPRYHLLKEG
ncbi:hypothetical protein EXN66_Car002410 [Channa argus]|uniref:Uncharacterized protein n=1 Tax=Channa argus TaxID=215402 RepID=A0A6G1P9M2_CHAAH|nr:hypothetical protein EXN66_Car002410 [Channa argus]